MAGPTCARYRGMRDTSHPTNTKKSQKRKIFLLSTNPEDLYFLLKTVTFIESNRKGGLKSSILYNVNGLNLKDLIG